MSEFKMNDKEYDLNRAIRNAHGELVDMRDDISRAISDLEHLRMNIAYEGAGHICLEVCRTANDLNNSFNEHYLRLKKAAQELDGLLPDADRQSVCSKINTGHCR